MNVYSSQLVMGRIFDSKFLVCVVGLLFLDRYYADGGEEFGDRACCIF